MRLSCEIVEDLLPLYEDKVCSPQSREAVEEHLQTCEKCRQLIASAREVSIPAVEPQKTETDQIVMKSLRKIRLRWWVSLLLIVVMIPFGIMGWNQYQGEGIHFTNLHERILTEAFLSKLQKGDYEGAYACIDIEPMKAYFLAEWFDIDTLANMEEDGRRIFCQVAAGLEEIGGITDYEYIGIRKTPFDYELIYSVTVEGKSRKLVVTVTDDGIQSFYCDGSFLENPLANLAIWDEYLWQFYEGCYFDPETGSYIYYEEIR